MTLPERLSNEKPSRELADEVLLALGWTKDKSGYWQDEDGYYLFRDGAPTNPQPLHNLQDAVDLIPEGWCGDISFHFKESAQVRIWNGKFAPCGQEHEAIAPTMPVAVCIAALKARGGE